MILSLIPLAAFLSLVPVPFALQVDTNVNNGSVDNQRAEVIHEEPRAEVSDQAPDQAPDQAEDIAGETVSPTETTVEPIDAIGDIEAEPVSEPGLTPDNDTGAGVVTEADPSVVTGDARDALLTNVAGTLSAVTTAKGRFSQNAPDGSMSEGDFYLRRPGRVRFEYDDPVPILIVADGATVAIEDRDLETQDRVPLRTTPLSLLLDDEIDFENDAEILNVRRANGYVAVAMSDRTGQTEGTLEMIFTDDPLELVGWQTIDETGGLTIVGLTDIETGMRINPRLFRIEDPDEDQGRD
ncbi:MAG: outer-membrane lipoprotein carrier protein LolA [Pseudomonadota bacterium]